VTSNGMGASTSTRLVDFDAFRLERTKSEPVVVLVGGQEYELPADLPATVALEALRLQEGINDGSVDPGLLVSSTHRIATGLFGEEQLARLLDSSHLSLAELSELIGRVLGAYGSAAVAPPPNRATRRAASRSSSAGPS
jgi:hypothetical protein